MPKNSTCPKVITPNSMNNIPISYGNNTTTQPIQWTSMSLSIKISSWQIISRSHSRLSSTLTLNSSKTILKRLNATDNAQALRKCNIPRSVQLVARKHSSQNAQRRLHLGIATRKSENSFQHTAARRRLRLLLLSLVCVLFQHTAARRRLLQYCYLSSLCHSCFNTQPRRGGCYNIVTYHLCAIAVSTHSRAKAAAGNRLIVIKLDKVSTHSRAKAAAFGMVGIHLDTGVSTHSHPKVAA